MKYFKEYINEENFLKENESTLFLNEDVNNTLLGILSQKEKEKHFFRIENNDKVELIGVVTKKERKGLIVYIEDLNISIDVYEFLVNELVSRNIELKEIKAPKGIANIIFDLYTKKVNVEKISEKNLT